MLPAQANVGAQRDPALPAPSEVNVTTSGAGMIVIEDARARFEIAPTGYIRASLLDHGHALSLDNAPADAQGSTGEWRSASGSVVTVDGKPVSDFAFDLRHPTITAVSGKLGAHGKRVELKGRSRTHRQLEETLAVEVYDDFPTLAVASASFGNLDARPLALGSVTTQAHRFDASSIDAHAPSYAMWSFQGASEKWGNDDIVQLTQNFARENIMAAPNARGEGGGIPVVAFWTAHAGVAIGHIETVPLVSALPVKVAADGRVDTGLVTQANTTLNKGEVYSTPRSFLAVFSGDYYWPLRLYSSALQREGWSLPKPGAESYNIAWCGWGYEQDVTPAQMIGTIPKLKEFGIHWATLDDRWFDTYGDWEPRPDTFPGDTIRRMVDTFHRQGILTQIWWLPLAAEDGSGSYDGHQYRVSKIVQQHPDWLILNKDGSRAHMVRKLAVLCPAVPEVQDYYRHLTERFIRDWDFDGHKLDNVFTVPRCYNPAHHHKSPDESIQAMGKVFNAIFQTTRALKPESVTQICPCGTPPNLAWLPFMNQAVTADPVGSVQVRRRVKMYKALLGPDSAVYGDHVELTRIEYDKDENEHDLGSDFASTLGTGGVLGTKFVWPDPGAHFREVLLTPEREAIWKKWTALYNSKMLSRGEFLDLYNYGYDDPEAYAIAKDGNMYYAFFAPEPSGPATRAEPLNPRSWSGAIELRGLHPRKYRVRDYENDRDLGVVDASKPRLEVHFVHHLLLEADPQ